MVGVRRTLRALRANILQYFLRPIWRVFRKIWWTFWSLIDEITEGSELD